MLNFIFLPSGDTGPDMTLYVFENVAAWRDRVSVVYYTASVDFRFSR
jgi:hypothetical protein